MTTHISHGDVSRHKHVMAGLKHSNKLLLLSNAFMTVSCIINDVTSSKVFQS